VLAGRVDDLQQACADEIARAVMPMIECAASERERDLIARLEQALETGGAAAAGLDEVLSMLDEHRVETFLILDRSDLRAGLCPMCGRVSTEGARHCPLDGHALAQVDAVEYAID
jgi:peptide subunit release factor 1 (eRF1)